jgi:site-specific recombinase XerD
MTDQLPALIAAQDPDVVDARDLENLPPELVEDLADGAELIRRRRAASTVRAYDSDLRVLFAYLRDRGQPDQLPVDPLLVVAFVSAESRPDDRPGREREARAISTIERRIAAIGKAHQLAGLPDPTKDQRVRDALTGARRRLLQAPSHAKDPLELEALDNMLDRIPADTHAGRRDRALLLTGIAATLRRAELVALDVEDVKFEPEGMLISIRKSKTDQAGAGETLAIAYGDRKDLCAVRAIRAWLEGAGITSGAIFRRVRRHDQLTDDRITDKSVALIVKKHAAAVGLDPDLLAGHSLRSGGTTAAAREGHNERELARLTRHKDLSVLRGYIRRANAFEDAAQVLTSRVRR